MCRDECRHRRPRRSTAAGATSSAGSARSCTAGRCRGEAPGTCADSPCGGVCTTGAATPPDAIVVGGGTPCARLIDGSMRCWAATARGQLGRGTETLSEPRPPRREPRHHRRPARRRSDLVRRGIAHLRGGRTGHHRRPQQRALLAPTPCGAARAAAGLALSAPRRRDEVVGASMLAAGGDHTCALTAMGSMTTLLCWGNNADGQAGVGVPSAFVPAHAGVDRDVPVDAAHLPRRAAAPNTPARGRTPASTAGAQQPRRPGARPPWWSTVTPRRPLCPTPSARSRRSSPARVLRPHAGGAHRPNVWCWGCERADGPRRRRRRAVAPRGDAQRRGGRFLATRAAHACAPCHGPGALLGSNAAVSFRHSSPAPR